MDRQAESRGGREPGSGYGVVGAVGGHPRPPGEGIADRGEGVNRLLAGR